MRTHMLTGLAGACLTLSLSLAFARVARADVAPGPTPTPACGANDTAAASPCSGKKAGDACTLASGGAGQCQALRCTTDGGATLLGCVAPSATADGGTSGPVSSSSNCAIHAPGARAGGAGLTLLGLAASLALAAVRRRRP